MYRYYVGFSCEVSEINLTGCVRGYCLELSCCYCSLCSVIMAALDHTSHVC